MFIIDLVGRALNRSFPLENDKSKNSTEQWSKMATAITIEKFLESVILKGPAETDITLDPGFKEPYPLINSLSLLKSLTKNALTV